MKKTLLTILFGFIVYLPSIAQTISVTKHDTTAYYMRNDFAMASGEADAKSLRLIIKVDSGLFRIEDYYMDATPKMLAYSFLDRMNFEGGTQGKRIDYYPNGKEKIVSYYKSGQEVGDAISYYPNGKVYNIITYSGKDAFLKECRDSTDRVLCENGNGKWIKFNDYFNIYVTGNVVNGKEDGEWIGSPVNNKKMQGVYADGKLISGDLSFSKKQKFLNNYDVPPMFKGGVKGFALFLSKTIVYPKKAREDNVQGNVNLSFIVDIEGNITDIEVLRGIGGGADEEAVRALKTSPRWKPAIKDGKPVPVQFSVPVNFSLTADNTSPVSKSYRKAN